MNYISKHQYASCESDTLCITDESKDDANDYTQMAANYIVIENKPSDTPATYTFPTLDELYIWAATKCGKNTIAMDDVERRVKSELLTKINTLLGGSAAPSATAESIQDRYPHAFSRVQSALNDKFKLKLSDAESVLSAEYIEEFANFRQHPEYVHYYGMWLINRCAAFPFTDTEVKGLLRAFTDKELMFEVKATEIFYCIKPYNESYHNCVKLLQSIFGEILPELAYGLVRWTFEDDYFNPLAFDAKHTAKLWAQKYLETFYEKSEDASVRRSEFIEHFQKHAKTIVDKLGAEEDFNKFHVTEVLANLASPEKVLGLSTVRRAPGMVIPGYRLKQSVSTEPKELNSLELESSRSMLIETHQVLSNTCAGSILTITTPEDLKKGYGYTRFRILEEDVENVPEVTLMIGGTVIDRVYPSEQKEKDSHLLFNFTNKYFIPPLHYHEIKIIMEKTKKSVKILYDVVKPLCVFDPFRKYTIPITITQRMVGYYGQFDTTTFNVSHQQRFEGNIQKLKFKLSDTAYDVRYIYDTRDESKYIDFKKNADNMWVCEFPKGGIDFLKFETPYKNVFRFKDTTAEKYDFYEYAETTQYINFFSGMASPEYKILT